MTTTPLESALARAASAAAAPVLVESSRELPLVTIAVALRSGSAEDPVDQEGLTRFAGRMMRRSGGGRSATELDAAIDALGGSIGVESTHSTTAVHGTVISRSLDEFVDLVSDIVARPGFAGDEHERLQRETNAELIEARDHDRALMRRWFRRKFYADHPYGRSTTGTSASIQRICGDSVRQHHRRTFVRDNLVFAFSGDVDEERARNIAGRISSALPRGAAPSYSVTELTRPSGRHLVIVDKPERTQTQILIGCLGTHPRDEDHVPLVVANTVFGGTFTARLMNEVRSKRGWSYGAYSALPYDRRRRAFTMWTFPKAEDAAPCIKLQLEMLRKLLKEGISKKELQRAQRYLIRSHAFALDTASKRVGLKLDAALYDLPRDYYGAYVERVRQVTLEQANSALLRRLSADDLMITVVGTAAQIGDSVRRATEPLATAEIVQFDAE